MRCARIMTYAALVRPCRQVKYSSLAQALGQAGRAIGPVLATSFYGVVRPSPDEC